MTFRARVSSMVEHMWDGNDAWSRTARSFLVPAEWLFTRAVDRRNRGYEQMPTLNAPLAAISVGNLTVGGTGKTPVAAWCVSQLRAAGARPAVVMRGYGDDEWRVHALLNPGAPVIVAADRREGLITARVRGADCAVLDDAFQHRRVARAADVVLVSADRWRDEVRLLPAGPFREPLRALQRAHVVVVTVKAANLALVTRTVQAVTRAAPAVPVAVVRLVPDTLRLAVTLPREDAPSPGHGVPSSLSPAASWLAGRTVHVATAIGDPTAFVAQLRALGTTVRALHRYPDHHAFSESDVRAIATSAAGSDGVVCTLKDAVKLAVLWPREAPPLWYVSQTVVVERGAEALDRALARVLAARAGTAPTAG